MRSLLSICVVSLLLTGGGCVLADAIGSAMGGAADIAGDAAGLAGKVQMFLSNWWLPVAGYLSGRPIEAGIKRIPFTKKMLAKRRNATLAKSKGASEAPTSPAP